VSFKVILPCDEYKDKYYTQNEDDDDIYYNTVIDWQRYRMLDKHSQGVLHL